MLFASLISTYLISKGRSIVGPFPHEACNPPLCAVPLKPILNIPVTSFSTFVLLMSSLAMVLALAAVENRGKPELRGSPRLVEVLARHDGGPRHDVPWLSRRTSSRRSCTKG